MSTITLIGIPEDTDPAHLSLAFLYTSATKTADRMKMETPLPFSEAVQSALSLFPGQTIAVAPNQAQATIEIK